MALTIDRSSYHPVKSTLADGETWIEVKPATIEDEVSRGKFLFGETPPLLIELAIHEIGLVILDTNILDENSEPIFKTGMLAKILGENAAILLHQHPDAFWEIHELLRKANAQWQPAKQDEVNPTPASQ